jgi:hypothetical protein
LTAITREDEEGKDDMDHGYEVDENKRCTATTQKQRQCSLPPLRGIERCALHAGLAKPNGSPEHGDPTALEAYKRSLNSRERQPARSR